MGVFDIVTKKGNGDLSSEVRREEFLGLEQSTCLRWQMGEENRELLRDISYTRQTG